MSSSFIDFKYDHFTDKLYVSRFSHQHHELFNGLRGEKEEKAVADVQQWKIIDQRITK